MTFDEITVRIGRGLFVAGLLTGLTACGSGGGNNVNVNTETIPLQPLSINVLSVLLTPGYTLNGGAFEVSEYNDGNFVLRSTMMPTDIALLGSSHDANPAPVRVVQGAYDVLFQHETGASVPQNVDTPVQTGIAIISDQALPVAVNAWTVTPVFLHNNSAFPTSEYDDGLFYLQPTAGGERIFIGNSHTASPDPVQVMDGSYDVIYSLETGGDLVPGNQSAVVMNNVPINADISAFAIDVKSVRFQLSVTLDSGAFPLSQYSHAKFFLRSTTTDDRVELGKSYELPLTQMVAEGTYDIVYQYVQGDNLPVNTDAVIAAGMVIGSGGVGSVTLDISSVAITPAFTLDIGDGNGPLAFPASEYNDANFYLRSVNSSDDVMFIGASNVAPVAVRVINSDMDTDTGAGVVMFGAYDVLYRHETGEAVPQNVNAVVQKNITLNSSSGLAVPVASVSITGRFTLNGRAFPGDASDSVQFLLQGDDADDVFLFGFSDVNNAPVRLVSMPGSYETYDVIFDHLEGDAVPQNKMHVAQFNEQLNVDGALLVDVTAKRIDPAFTLDGAAFQSSVYQSARFYLRDTSTSKRVFLGSSYKDNKAVTVLNGTYDIIYEHRNGGEVPQNVDSKVGVVNVQ